MSPLDTTRKDNMEDQPIGGEMTWTNTGETQSGRNCTIQANLEAECRLSTNHWAVWLPNDDDDDANLTIAVSMSVCLWC